MAVSSWRRLSSILLVTLAGVNAGDYCLTKTIEYCHYGCCGKHPKTECCSISGGVITGIVIGGIVLVAVGIGLVAYFVYYFKQKKIRGQVVHAPAPVVINTGYAGPPTVATYSRPDVPAVAQPVMYQAPGVPAMYTDPAAPPSGPLPAQSVYVVSGHPASSGMMT